MLAVSLRSMLGYDFERQLCNIAPKITSLTSEQVSKQNLVDRAIIDSLIKYKKHNERVRKSLKTRKRESEQMLHQNSDNFGSVRFDPEVRIKTYNSEEPVINTQQQNESFNTNTNIDDLENVLENNVNEEQNSDNVTDNSNTIIGIITECCGLTTEQVCNMVSECLNSQTLITEKIASVFTNLLTIENTVTNSCFEIIKTYYPIYMCEINSNNKQANHFRIAKKIMEKFLEKLQPYLVNVNSKIKEQILQSVKNTLFTTNIEQLEQQYVKICTYCDVFLNINNTNIISDKSVKKGAFKLKLASQVAQTLGIKGDSFSNITLENQITQNNIYCMPKCFIADNNNIESDNVYVIANEYTNPESIDLQKNAEKMAADYAAIMVAANPQQTNNVNGFCVPEIFKQTSFNNSKNNNIVTIRESEYAAILRILIRQKCNNGVYNDKTKTIYNSKIFRVIEMLTPFIELHNGVIGCDKNTLNNTHISDIIKYSSILQRRIYSLEQLKQTLNNYVSNFIAEKQQYMALINQVKNNNINSVRDIVDNNNNIYGYQQIADACVEFNRLLRHTVTNYPGSLNNNNIIAGYLNLLAINTIIREERVGYFIEEICANTRELYRISCTLMPQNVVDNNFTNLHNAINTMIKKENFAQKLIEKFSMLKNFETMENDVKTYENIRKKFKIEKIINFYKTQLSNINKHINKDKCVAIKTVKNTLQKKLNIDFNSACEPMNFETKNNLRKQYNVVERVNTHIILSNRQRDKYWNYYVELANYIGNNYNNIIKPEMCDQSCNINKLKLYNLMYNNL